MKKVLCFIGWHSLFSKKHWQWLENDGCSDHVKCGWCGYKGKIDSTGSLF